MKTSCRIVIDYDSEKIAKTVYESINVDNFDFVKAETKGNQLVAEVDSKSVSSLIHTLDDLLSCIGVAEKIVE